MAELMNLPRTPWKSRRARNADAIDTEHVWAFVVAKQPRGNIHMQDFLNWLGLKATPTAALRAGIALRKAGRMPG